MEKHARRPEIAFATPRKLPKARDLAGRVAVVDVAFASEASSGGFSKVTRPFIDALGTRLAAWVDHHDHERHVDYASDPRFVLRTKAQHGACPEMVTAELVARMGPVDTIVCHTDFDGLCSAAKWIRGGVEPYPGADTDAHAIDTRTAVAGPVGQRIDRALRARPRDLALYGLVVRHLVSGLEDASLWAPIDEAAAELATFEESARAIARRYARIDLPARHKGEPRDGLPESATALAFVDATPEHGSYDKTLLLLLGQDRASIAAVVDTENLTFAARFDSGINFLRLFGLSGGMPTLVSIPKTRLRDALISLGVTEADLARVVA